MFENIDLTSLSGLIDFIGSLIGAIFDFIYILITIPLQLGGFFPNPFNIIFTAFFYILITLLLWKFFK